MSIKKNSIIKEVLTENKPGLNLSLNLTEIDNREEVLKILKDAMDLVADKER